MSSIRSRYTPTASVPEKAATAVAGVCSNWAREASRFAPELEVLEYTGDGRAALLERLREDGRGKLLVVSYALLQLGMIADAIEPLQTALRLSPQYRDARYLLSDVYSRLGRYNEAAESWGKFLEIVPNGPEALTKQAWAYLYLDEHGREAATDARR